MSKIRIWWRKIDQAHVLKLMRDSVHEAVADGKVRPEDFWGRQKPEVSAQTVTTLFWYLRKRLPDQQLLLFGNILEDALRTELVSSRLYGAWLLPSRPPSPETFVYIPPSSFGLELLFRAAKDSVYEAVWDGALPVEGLFSNPRTKAVLWRYLKKRVPEICFIYFLGEIGRVLERVVEGQFDKGFLGELVDGNGALRHLYVLLNESRGMELEKLEESLSSTSERKCLECFRTGIWDRERFVRDHRYLERSLYEPEIDRRNLE